MSTETITVAVFLIVVAALVVWAMERSHARAAAAYDRVIDNLSKENRDLLDRMFVSKGQPPTGTDMRAREEEQRTARAERRERSPVTNQTGGPLKAVQMNLAAAAAARGDKESE
jgi:uncharacterized membrane protein